MRTVKSNQKNGATNAVQQVKKLPTPQTQVKKEQLFYKGIFIVNIIKVL